MHSCIICKGHLKEGRTQDYRVCLNCGHEFLSSPTPQTFIINEALHPNLAQKKTSGLEKFQVEVIKDLMKGQGDLLIDIGCGSGRFLANVRHLFAQVVGVELTKECVDFARSYLSLDVRTSIPTMERKASVITLWHSLEHIQETSLLEVVSKIEALSGPKTHVVISVPSNSGLQYRLFYQKFAYYDIPNHTSQFSRTSLIHVMKQFGFGIRKEVFSGPYIRFGYLQGFLNQFNRHHNYLYYRLKRKQTFGLSAFQRLVADSLNVVGALFFLPVSLSLSLVEYFIPRHRSVLTLIFSLENA